MRAQARRSLHLASGISPGAAESKAGLSVASNPRIRILLCSQQPFLVRGFVTVLRRRPGFKLVGCCESLGDVQNYLKTAQPMIVLVHLTGQVDLAELRALKCAESRTQVVLWGDGLAGEFAFQAMQLGVRGVLPSTATIDCLLGSLQNINRGVLCFERDLVDSVLSQKRVALTERQGQIVSLVAQGFKNKEIAWSLGLTEGTVKVYLYKLFRKLGVSDRLDMALYAQKNLFNGQMELDKFRKARRSTTDRAVAPFGPRSLPLQFSERARVQSLN
jgi:two-component system, NarL family, nitrate/nitrite response regulator NarL